jgi:hypothetical protein
LLKRRHKHNKEDKAFLLIELRVGYTEIPTIAFMCKCVTTQVDSSLTDLCTSSWSPFHIDLCCFKVSVLAPLQWGHQTVSYFGFPTYFHISHMCSPLVMLSTKSFKLFVYAHLIVCG